MNGLEGETDFAERSERVADILEYELSKALEMTATVGRFLIWMLTGVSK